MLKKIDFQGKNKTYFTFCIKIKNCAEAKIFLSKGKKNVF